ncbi:NAD-dependent epimerase/dehydratase family protein (plasmid) [Streptomyces xanthophaeus]|uniref:NAD-dependent epimerase/dehydratase family protein n=1 Tax=Streptomyces xanthophaeus TaxID=67385 RepID=UPI00398F9452
MNTLIIGGSGFLGAELIRQAKAAGHTTAATYASKPGDTPQAAWHHLDLRDASSLDAVITEVRPDVILADPALSVRTRMSVPWRRPENPGEPRPPRRAPTMPTNQHRP